MTRETSLLPPISIKLKARPCPTLAQAIFGSRISRTDLRREWKNIKSEPLDALTFPLPFCFPPPNS